jgi:hypothetical protein
MQLLRLLLGRRSAAVAGCATRTSPAPCVTAPFRSPKASKIGGTRPTPDPLSELSHPALSTFLPSRKRVLGMPHSTSGIASP